MKNYTKIIIGTFITLALFVGAYYVADTDKAYYCESRDLVGICDKLSGGLGTRCYYEDTYKICNEGWEELEEFIEKKQEVIYVSDISLNKVRCNQTICIPWHG